MMMSVHREKRYNPGDKSRQLCASFCPECFTVCECRGVGGGRTGGGERENAELSVFEWAHYSAQREALYSAQPAYHTIEVTKQL